MKYYAATEDGYIKKSIRDGSMAIFEDIDDAEVVRAKLKCELIEISVIKKETHDRLTEENAKLRDILEMVIFEAERSYGEIDIDDLKEQLNQLKDQNNDNS